MDLAVQYGRFRLRHDWNSFASRDKKVVFYRGNTVNKSREMDTEFREKKLPEIKQYLKQRGVKTTGYKKNELILLAAEAKSQNISEIPADDYIKTSELRRTVGDAILPHPQTLSNWSENLTNIPPIESFDVHHYLKNSCKWTNDRLKGYKNDGSYRLHSNGHIHDVKISKSSGNTQYVKAKCVPEERQSADPYDIWVIVLNDGSIHSAECTCVAGDGTCKHVAALLFGLQRFYQSLSDTSDVSVTDIAAQWVNPTRTSIPTKITCLDLRSDPSGEAPMKPTTEQYIPSSQTHQNIEKEVMRLIKQENLPACAAYVLSDSSESELDFEPFPDNIIDLASKFHKINPSSDTLESFVEFLQQNIDNNYVSEVSNRTVEQNESDMWFYQRQGRITASIVFNCLHFTGRSSDAHLINLILGLTNELNSDVPALRHGKKYESIARKDYIKDKKVDHTTLTCKLSGLIVDENIPYLGASPDGLVECDCCGEGCLEIKCPFKYCNETPLKAACLDTKNFNIINEKPFLKRSEKSPYYCQIQCQLAVTNRKWCDFVLFTHKGLLSEQVSFDEQFWLHVLAKLSSFYKAYILPKLLK